LNALVRPFLRALTSRPFVSIVMKLCHNKEPQVLQTNTYSGVRPPPRIATSKAGFEGPSGVGELNLRVLRVPSPVISLLRRIVSLLWRNYLPVIVLFRVHPGKSNSQAVG